MLVSFFVNIFTFLQLNQILFYGGVFSFAFLESMAIIGLFLPGTSVLTFVGLMSFYDYGNPYLLAIASFFGALFGDIISYWLGTKGVRFFRYEARLLKLAHLDKSCLFFQRYGLVSIFVGRFVGPLRPLIPFVAGLSKVDLKIFVKWSIFASFCWSLVTIFSGFVFAMVADYLEFRLSITIGVLLILFLFVGLFLPIVFCLTRHFFKIKISGDHCHHE